MATAALPEQPPDAAAAGLPGDRHLGQLEDPALKQYLAVFPGDWNVWQHFALVADAQGLPVEAWRAIQIAQRLESDDDAGWSVEVNLAKTSMSPDELRRWLDQTATAHFRGRGSADVALALAGGYALLVRKGLAGAPSVEREELLAKAQAAVTHGRALLTPRTEPGIRRYVRAMQLVINELRAGREPKASILDRAGLPELHEFLDRNDHDTLAAEPRRGSGSGSVTFAMWRPSCAAMLLPCGASSARVRTLCMWCVATPLTHQVRPEVGFIVASASAFQT